MKKALLIATLLSAGITAANAQQISQSEAQAIAKSFFGGPAFKNRPSVQPELAYTSIKEGKTHFYIFNDKTSDKGGFVIVGGDKLAKPILGYSENGSFDYNAIPENFKWWLSQYDDQISFAIKHPDLIEKDATGTRAGKTDIAALVSTTWNQDDPYNSEIPTLGSGYPSLVTGCVATAMAQIMKFHNYPSSGIGSNSYSKTWGSPVGTKIFSADFGATTYDWSNMLDDYSGSYTTAQAIAVGTLLYHCGVSVNMNYGQAETGGSSATSATVAQALSNNFDYDKSVYEAARCSYNDTDWENLIYGELQANRPVLYSGQSSSGGHAFVCDGYRNSDNFFHFNWGWGGSADGYYAMSGADPIHPTGGGIGGASASYSGSQGAVINIMPNCGGDYNYIIANDTYSIIDSSWNAVSSADRSSTIFFNGSFHNQSSITSDITLGVKFVGKTKHSTYYVNCATIPDFTIGSYTTDPLAVRLNSIAENDTYEVYPAFCVNGDTDNWMDVATGLTTAPTITITGTEPAITLTKTAVYPNGGYAVKDNYSMTISVKNTTNSSANVTFEVLLDIYDTETNRYKYSGQDLFSETKEIEANSIIDVKFNAGAISGLNSGKKCRLYIFANGTQLGYQVEMTVCDNIAPYEMTSAGWGTICLPFDAALPSGLTAYSCSAVSGNELVLTTETELKKNTPYILSGAAGNYDIVGPEIPEADLPSTAQMKGYLCGAVKTDAVTLSASDYILQQQSSGVGFFRNTGTTRKAAKYKAFLRSSSLGAMMYAIAGTTNIDEIEDAEQVTPVGIYDLSGRMIETLQKGTNIIKMSDGSVRKVIVK